MSTGDFLSIQPTELKFPLELRKQSSCSIQLANKTDTYVAFKVCTTNRENYSVRPNIGVLLPKTTCTVTVTMRTQKELPPDMYCKDKFLIKSVVAPDGATSKDITSGTLQFNKEKIKTIKEFKLRVVYINTGNLLSIQPTELKFLFELKKQSSCSMQLTNKTDKNVVFKVKTTNPREYCVRPNNGVVLPKATCNVTVIMQAQKEAPPDMYCKDKFLIQSMVASDGATSKDIIQMEGKIIEEFKLRVIYMDTRDPPNIQPTDFKFLLESRKQSSFSMDTGNLLSIQSTELKFPLELKKQSSCSMQLTNKTDKYVAFRVKTTNPLRYCVRPKNGVVLPKATCNITVVMQAQKEAPRNMYCTDKFLIQTVVAPDGATSEDAILEWEGKTIEEFKLRVVYMDTRDLPNIQPTDFKSPPIMQSPKEAPPDMPREDKFLLQMVAALANAASKDTFANMFYKKEGRPVELKPSVAHESTPSFCCSFLHLPAVRCVIKKTIGIYKRIRYGKEKLK